MTNHYSTTHSNPTLKNKTEGFALMIHDAIVQADKGVFISEDAMTTWFESLGTHDELPEPEADVFLQHK
jgi:hypothetical protein